MKVNIYSIAALIEKMYRFLMKVYICMSSATNNKRGCHGHDRMVVASWVYSYLCNQCLSPLKSKVVSLNPVHGKVYSKQYYVIKFVSDLRQVCGFLWVLQFPPWIVSGIQLSESVFILNAPICFWPFRHTFTFCNYNIYLKFH